MLGAARGCVQALLGTARARCSRPAVYGNDSSLNCSRSPLAMVVPPRRPLALALCGLILLVRGHAMATAPAAAPTADQPLSADLLLPETDNDLVTMLSHLMSAQHELVLAEHGPDSLEAALSHAATTAQDQFTNWYLQFQNNPPLLFDLAYNFVSNFSAAANATLAKISPNLANNTEFQPLTWFYNSPKIARNTQQLVEVRAYGVELTPCFFRLSARGVYIQPVAIQVSPRFLDVGATGISISPEAVSISPTFIGVTPSGQSIGLTHVAVSPTFISVTPNIQVVAFTNLPPKFSNGTSINPKPKLPTITNAMGKQVLPPPQNSGAGGTVANSRTGGTGSGSIGVSSSSSSG